MRKPKRERRRTTDKKGHTWGRRRKKKNTAKGRCKTRQPRAKSERKKTKLGRAALGEATEDPHGRASGDTPGGDAERTSERTAQRGRIQNASEDTRIRRARGDNTHLSTQKTHPRRQDTPEERKQGDKWRKEGDEQREQHATTQAHTQKKGAGEECEKMRRGGQRGEDGQRGDKVEETVGI